MTINQGLTFTQDWLIHKYIQESNLTAYFQFDVFIPAFSKFFFADFIFNWQTVIIYSVQMISVITVSFTYY